MPSRREFTYDLTTEDWFCYLHVAQQRVMKPGSISRNFAVIAVVTAFVIGALLLLVRRRPGAAVITAGLAALFIYSVGYALERSLRAPILKRGSATYRMAVKRLRKFYGTELTGMTGTYNMTVDDEIIAVHALRWSTMVRWEHVDELIVSDDFCLLFTAPLHGMIFPRHGFARTTDYDELTSLLQRKVELLKLQRPQRV